MSCQSGILLGIMVESDRRRKSVLQRYVKHLPPRMTLVGFTPSSIDWNKARIRGLLLKNGRWVEGELPFPNVVYNRCYRLDITTVQRMNHVLGTRWFNQANGFNKLEIHECLTRWLSPHLPPAWGYDKDAVPGLLNEHKLLYLKPCTGNLGRGVYRVERKDSGEIHIADHHTLPRVIVNSEASLQDNIEDLIGSTPYLIQQGVHVRKIQNRHFDIRILAQKNREGQWSVTAAVSRLAYSGCFNTSICEKVIPSTAALRHLYSPTEVKRMMKSLYDMSLRAAEIVETDTGNHLCEASVDFALDTQGHPWVIEMNGKPDKGMYSGVSRHCKAVYTKPLQYAGYLGRRFSGRLPSVYG
ncbi:YheC/YheD family protein [Paenibacillus sp. S-38]|uniref:YheC/YheD family endospore coat-associated protein n=1 Tax=Paenibacillus sp. S-38 TaxID=3416710 RepID=UPI003CE71F0B